MIFGLVSARLIQGEKRNQEKRKSGKIGNFFFKILDFSMKSQNTKRSRKHGSKVENKSLETDPKEMEILLI